MDYIPKPFDRSIVFSTLSLFLSIDKRFFIRFFRIKRGVKGGAISMALGLCHAKGVRFLIPVVLL
jgi:hypothetical protein